MPLSPIRRSCLPEGSSGALMASLGAPVDQPGTGARIVLALCDDIGGGGVDVIFANFFTGALPSKKLVLAVVCGFVYLTSCAQHPTPTRLISCHRPRGKVGGN